MHIHELSHVRVRIYLPAPTALQNYLFELLGVVDFTCEFKRSDCEAVRLLIAITLGFLNAVGW